MSMFADDLGNGEKFYAQDRFEPKPRQRFGGCKNDRDVAAVVADLWGKAYYAKQPEIERLKTMELAYSGFHYTSPKANREKEITNLCFTTVETVWPVMVEALPRPEIIARQSMSSTQAENLRAFAESLMDTSHWDVNHWLGTRTKLKLGWNVNLIVFDPATGMPYPKQWSPFNFYPDPCATCEADLEYFFLAAPIPTRRLRSMFKEKAHLIKPDGMVSPSYDVYVRPYFDNYRASSPTVVGPSLSFSRESFADLGSGTMGSDPIATTTTSLIDAPGGPVWGYQDTTFLIQLVIRDYSEHKVKYAGMKEVLQDGHRVQIPHYEDYWEPCSESGWSVIQMTSDGVILDEAPLDTCFLGLPTVIGRDYWHEGRFYSIGEQDQILPINRAYNKRKYLLNRALEFESLPLMLVDRDIGADFDAGTLEPGDVIKANRGARAEYLNFQGPQSGQFELLQLSRMDGDIISGVHDVQSGRKPAGVESGVAMRQLQEAGQTRIRGKERPGFHEQTILLKKMMYCAAKKLNRNIMFQARGGQQMSIAPQELLLEYDIRFAQGTGMASSKAQLEEKLLNMFQLGLIDRQAVLEQSGIPGWQVIAQRMAMMEQLAAQSAPQPAGREQ